MVASPLPSHLSTALSFLTIQSLQIAYIYVAIMASPATDSAAAVSTSIPHSLAMFDLFDNHPFTLGQPHAPSLLCTCGTSCLSSDFIQITHSSLGQAK